MNVRATVLAVLSGGALALAACSSSEGPVAGELEVRLTTPNTDDRAILFRLAGRESGVAVPSGSAYRVLVSPGLGDTVRVLVMAPQGSALAAGAVARVTVPDTRQVASYAAQLVDVASTTYAKRVLTGYALTVVKP